MGNTVQNQQLFDVIVIGGGPSGMTAAGRAASKSAKVLLLEKNSSLGKKLLLTGGGRCNITNNKPDNKQLIACYKDKPQQLHALFHRFNVTDSLNFFKEYGLNTIEENDGRLFPSTEKSSSVLNVLLSYIKDNKVVVECGVDVKDVSFNNDNQYFEVCAENSLYRCKNLIIATGGLSHPETGSTGAGFKFASKFGHKIIPNSNVLVPIVLRGDWFKILSGTPVDDVEISVWQYGKKITKKRGRVLFTHFGLTGPTILNLSSKIGELLTNDEVKLTFDFTKDINEVELKSILNQFIELNKNKEISSFLKQFMPIKIITVFLNQLGIESKTPCHSITKENKKDILEYLKLFPLTVDSLLGSDKAIVTAGGVDINEIDFRSMQSRLQSRLFFTGDVLNIDRPSGGYSLQLCWSTGYVAGNSVNL